MEYAGVAQAERPPHTVASPVARINICLMAAPFIAPVTFGACTLIMNYNARPNYTVLTHTSGRRLKFPRHAFEKRNEPHVAQNIDVEAALPVSRVTTKLLNRAFADRGDQNAGRLELLQQ